MLNNLYFENFRTQLFSQLQKVIVWGSSPVNIIGAQVFMLRKTLEPDFSSAVGFSVGLFFRDHDLSSSSDVLGNFETQLRNCRTFRVEFFIGNHNFCSSSSALNTRRLNFCGAICSVGGRKMCKD